MAGSGGVAHASAYGSKSVCTVNSYGPRGVDEWVLVLGFDTDGDPIDSRFVASFTNLKPAAGSFGYLWNDNPVPPAAGHVPPADRSFDSAGQPILVHRTGVGANEVEVGAFAQDSPGPVGKRVPDRHGVRRGRPALPAPRPGRGRPAPSVMATPPAYCNIHAWWQAGGWEHGWVKCYDGGVGVLMPAMLYNVGFLA
jgi:hypothetical protein